MSPDSAVTRRAPVAAEDTPAEWAPKKDLGGYIVAKLLGGIAGAGVRAVIADGLLAGYNVGANGLGQNGWGEGYLGGYALSSGVVFEFVATLLSMIVILGSTFQRGQAAESLKSESLRYPVRYTLFRRPLRQWTPPARRVGGDAPGQSFRSLPLHQTKKW